MNFGIELASLIIISREPLCTMRNFQTTISSPLQSTEDTCTSRSAHQSYIQETMEGTWLVIFRLHHVLITIYLGLSLVDFVEFQLLEHSSSQQQTCTVGSGIVSQTDLHTITWQLMGIGSAYNLISLNFSIGDLTADVLVREAYYHAVFGSIILVFILNTKSFTCKVICLSFTSSSVLHLITLEVSLVLHYLHKRHLVLI